jgi:hypothetical protein
MLNADMRIRVTAEADEMCIPVYVECDVQSSSNNNKRSAYCLTQSCALSLVHDLSILLDDLHSGRRVNLWKR